MRISLFCIMMIGISGVALAQELPADPWVGRSPVQDRMDNVTVNVREGQAVRVRQGIGDAEGPRDAYKMDRTQYTGEATTFGGAYGQEMIAPEVNKVNIQLMTDHLRKMGYEIPPEYDRYIDQAPAWYRQKYMQALRSLNQSSDDPSIKMAANFKKWLEQATGLSLENFVDTSFKVIDN